MVLGFLLVSSSSSSFGSVGLFVDLEVVSALGGAVDVESIGAAVIGAAVGGAVGTEPVESGTVVSIVNQAMFTLESVTSNVIK